MNEPLTWGALLEQGLVTRRTVTNAEVQARFEGTVWADDDPVAVDAPEAPYLNLWIADLGPRAVSPEVV